MYVCFTVGKPAGSERSDAQQYPARRLRPWTVAFLPFFFFLSAVQFHIHQIQTLEARTVTLLVTL